MKLQLKNSSVFFTILIFLCSFFISFCSSSQDFDFFYFVQEWPASYCDTKRSCCYPKTGKPAQDFTIHGLWPNRYDGSWPQYCDGQSHFHKYQIWDLIPKLEKNWPSLNCPSSDGVKFWAHEWERHGTCSLLNENNYFQAALDLKEKANLLQVLKDARIEPNGDFYSLESIKEAIRKGLGYTSFVQCNVDIWQNQQLYQVYLCVDKFAKEFIDCPILPRGRSCGLEIEFPPFFSPFVDSI
ncbi:hypothetical protein M9H77_09973 [Catharanthus roseus]|uniref:Uncharacterized protein n=1 Tax=Catharanthus roseus TaxID=4058 RepID=A0ACC0C2L4_CATRO|nr:hypothetical protein M9H77_09973 [Catharanthus roseus]